MIVKEPHLENHSIRIQGINKGGYLKQGLHRVNIQ